MPQQNEPGIGQDDEGEARTGDEVLINDAARTGDDARTGDERDAVDAITAQWNRERPDLEARPMAVFGRIYRLSRLMGDRMEKEYQRYGIGRGEFDVLATLRRSGEPYTLSPRQLSATLMLTTGGMTGRLDKLEKAGLLERSPDPGDRRGLRVALTGRGLDVIDRAVGSGLALQTVALDGLDAEEAAQLSALLRKLLLATERTGASSSGP
ncbi:MarR family winged helix-turn-helix transcriptional regulator [Actinacidiphila acidipaludis]|uniref:MarR family transcriptional regulator n=1 Tax=Actinacidiphila acidipaludis TaxID=2873382 RepID=A0ABS7QCA1_9ACTN|nr:MarR family transcriptional regulator [Streptomyces acidipaludis]MBY8880781.1 MarR family transcriptional regulator [Streptomyces acidipaludis]